MNLDDAIRTRRSIRRYRTDAIPSAVVEEILDLARHAPSSLNGQPWHFVLIEDPAKKQALVALKDRLCPPEKRDFPATMLADAPLVIAVCVDRATSYDRGIENGVLATALLMLAAHSRGLGSVYMSAYRADEPRVADEIRAVLALPDNLDPITLLPLGYPAEEPLPKTLRPLARTRLRSPGPPPAPPSLGAILDRSQAASSSIVLRYLGAAPSPDGPGSELAPFLRRTTIREGVRSFPLMTHRDVTIHVLDETTAMHTRSFKAIDGCITSAHCLQQGYQQVVFETGGNTGGALTSYCSRVGIETFCFLPQANLGLLDSRTFADRRSHLLAVADRHQVKDSARRFAKQRGIPMVPAPNWRFEATRFRGYAILELLLEQTPFDWLVQTISAAFGPIGIYRVLTEHAHELPRLPRFLGVQQEANCPMFRAWRQSRGAPVPEPPPAQELLIPAMYDVRPMTHNTYRELEALLLASGGDLTTINATELHAFLQRDFGGRTAAELLAANGLHLSERGGGLIDKAGVVALAGLVQQIDRGTIPAGSRVLCSISGGANNGDGQAVADAVIRSPDDVDALYGGSLPRG